MPHHEQTLHSTQQMAALCLVQMPADPAHIDEAPHTSQQCYMLFGIVSISFILHVDVTVIIIIINNETSESQCDDVCNPQIHMAPTPSCMSLRGFLELKTGRRTKAGLLWCCKRNTSSRNIEQTRDYAQMRNVLLPSRQMMSNVASLKQDSLCAVNTKHEAKPPHQVVCCGLIRSVLQTANENPVRKPCKAAELC